jgi:hypothetical protein
VGHSQAIGADTKKRIDETGEEIKDEIDDATGEQTVCRRNYRFSHITR